MARIFFNKVESYFIVTNYKVLFSTLSWQPQLVPVNCLRSEELDKFLNSKKILLVRNPYDRLESFYRDKLQVNPKSVSFTNEFKWQDCQYLLLNIIFERKGAYSATFELERDTLMGVSFDEFVSNYLPFVFQKEPHLVPQVLSFFYVDNKKNILDIEYDEVFKIDDKEDLILLRDKFKIDTSINKNVTKNRGVLLTWSSFTRAIVNDLYKLDFESLNYSLIH